MKSLTIAGGITRDATLRTTQNGDKVAGFSVAVSEGFGDSKRALYFDCSLWGKRAEPLAPMLVKGTKVCVSGDLSTREHDGKTYLTLRANEVTLQSARQDRDDEPRRESPSGYAGGGRPINSNMDDEIPFAPEVR